MFERSPSSDHLDLPVTGASSGVGMATAKAAAARVPAALLVARIAEALASAVERIKGEGGRASFSATDVGNLAQLEGAARSALARCGRIDAWVNCDRAPVERLFFNTRSFDDFALVAASDGTILCSAAMG